MVFANLRKIVRTFQNKQHQNKIQQNQDKHIKSRVGRVKLTSEIKIAVSGHRKLTNLPTLKNCILAAADQILAAFPDRTYEIWSCLAEGADRILSRILVKSLEAKLIVVLPLPELEYIKDFETIESIEEFDQLKHIAEKVVLPDINLSRPQAYQTANHTLIEGCDLLVAIWDGVPARGPGGTSEVVESFKAAGKPLLWIHTDNELNHEMLSKERFPIQKE